MMATVRFSKDLTDTILKNAAQQLQTSVIAAKNSLDLPSDTAVRIYETLFKDVLAQVNSLPDGWMKTITEITVRAIGDEACSLSFSLSHRVRWPVEFPESHLASTGYGSSVRLKSHPDWDFLSVPFKAWASRVQAAESAQQEYVESVRAVLTTFTTLAPALKAWPPLWDLLPEATKNKHKEVTEKRKSEVNLDVDLSKMTAVAVAAKFRT
jgi:hypothetical protein